MDLEPFLIQPNVSILDAVAVIDATRKGAVLVVDKEKRLLGVVTDGDVRRAILAGLELKLPVSVLLERRSKELYPTPISAPASMADSERLALMRQHKIRHLPIVDEHNVVIDLAFLDDLLPASSMDLTAVVMAGGYGKRLRPLTEELPKPMLPLDGKPLLERLIGQLREAGVHRVQVTTHYKHKRIMDYFGDGTGFGVRIDYVHEEQPLGTAGALGLLKPSTELFLVINGDILTSVDFKALFVFHQEHCAEMTVAVREYTLRVPYGVIEMDGVDVLHIVEKPVVRTFVNAGIYLVNQTALRFIPRDGRRFDMPNLINALMNNHQRVVGFPIREYWLDIGQMEEYRRAQEDLANGRL